jgi:hypothetical protein
MVGESPDRVIYIYRNRSGQFRVYPSPVVVATGSSVAFKSVSRAEVTVNLPFGRPVVVPPDGTVSEAVAIPPDHQGYREYEVLVDGTYVAEGSSPPGFIVDP